MKSAYDFKLQIFTNSNSRLIIGKIMEHGNGE